MKVMQYLHKEGPGPNDANIVPSYAIVKRLVAEIKASGWRPSLKSGIVAILEMVHYINVDMTNELKRDTYYDWISE